MCACQPTDVVYAVKPSLALHSPTVTWCCVRAVQPLGMRFACVRRLLQFAPSQNIAMSAAVHRLTVVGHATQVKKTHRGSLCRSSHRFSVALSSPPTTMFGWQRGVFLFCFLLARHFVKWAKYLHLIDCHLCVDGSWFGVHSQSLATTRLSAVRVRISVNCKNLAHATKGNQSCC